MLRCRRMFKGYIPAVCLGRTAAMFLQKAEQRFWLCSARCAWRWGCGGPVTNHSLGSLTDKHAASRGGGDTRAVAHTRAPRVAHMWSESNTLMGTNKSEWPRVPAMFTHTAADAHSVLEVRSLRERNLLLVPWGGGWCMISTTNMAFTGAVWASFCKGHSSDGSWQKQGNNCLHHLMTTSLYSPSILALPATNITGVHETPLTTQDIGWIPRNKHKSSSRLPCTTNFSRGDFPAITAVKSDSRMKEFIFLEASHSVCEMVLLLVPLPATASQIWPLNWSQSDLSPCVPPAVQLTEVGIAGSTSEKA